MVARVSLEGGAVDEGGRVQFVLRLSETSIDNVTVNWRLLDGTGRRGVDYGVALLDGRNLGQYEGTVTFAPGETVKTIEVATTSNLLVQDDRAFVLEVSDPEGGALAGRGAALRSTGWVLDNDGDGLKRGLFVSNPVVVEGNQGSKLVSFDVSISRPAAANLTFDYRTSDGGGAAGSDYVARTGQVTIPAGETHATVTVRVSGDRALEPTEHFSLIVTPTNQIATGGAGAAGRALILDDDAGNAPVVTLEGGSADEGDRVPFILRLSKASIDDVTVHWRLLDGTGQRGVDYGVALVENRNLGQYEGTVTFAPGELTKTLWVASGSNLVDQNDRAFVLELTDAVGGRLAGRAPALREAGWVLDDDGTGLKRGLSVSDPVMVEGDGGSQLAVFDVSISRPADEELVFDFRTSNGSASAGSDYVARSGQVTFAAGETHATVKVRVKGDATVEATEGFNLVVTPTNQIATGGSGAAGRALVLDDDAAGRPPVLSLEGGSADEGERVPFVLRLDRPARDTVTVQWQLVDGTATASDDYGVVLVDGRNLGSSGGTVAFAAGEVTKTLWVAATSNLVDQNDRAFVLELTDPVGARLAGQVPALRGTGWILDDDGTGLKRSLFVSDPRVEEQTSTGRTVAVFDVELSQPADQRIVVRYATENDSARAGQDYAARSGSLTFEPGETRKSVLVPIAEDARLEQPEAFRLVVRQLPALIDPTDSDSIGRAVIDDSSIVGNNRANVLNGTANADAIFGLGGNDTLRGGAGGDSLFGGSGRDRLLGQAGPDLLDGGRGPDVLIGGGGADVFRFTSAAAAGNGRSADQIRDFQPNVDLADLSGIDAHLNRQGDQAFTFIGNRAFSDAPRELQYRGGVLRGDQDGDGDADFAIEFVGAPRLDADDFVL